MVKDYRKRLETITFVKKVKIRRKSIYIHPEVMVGQKVYVTLDTAYKCRYGQIAAAFLGYNKNWKKTGSRLAGYVVHIKVNSASASKEESFAILVLNHKNESVRIELTKCVIYKCDDPHENAVVKVFKTLFF